MKKPKTLRRAAIYTRFSTDKQGSTAAQLQVCKDICEREGFRAVATYSDEAISGGTSRRPEYLRMMEAARAKSFDVIVSEDTSRLWRNMGHMWPALKELEDLGIHVIGHGGLDTRREDSTLSLAVQGAQNDAYRAEIGRRTKRSLMAKAKAGEHTGGRAYGYRIKNGERQIEPSEAKIVRNIFEWRADGWSALRIARHLNETKVPPPGAHWTRKSANKATWRTSAIAGDHRRGIGILNNELYRGNVIYNRFHWKRSATDSEKRKPDVLPRDQWIIHHFPKLRIVPDALWRKVEQIQKADGPKRQAIKQGIKKSVWNARPRWWLSGILTCASCKSSLTINGRDYICPSAHAGSCTNRLRIKREFVESAILNMLLEHLMDPVRMEGEKKRVEKVLKEREKDEAEEARRAIDGTALKRIEADMANFAKVKSAAAREAAMNALLAEKAELEEAARRSVSGTSSARKMLARLPTLAREYENQMLAALRSGASQDEIADAREATAQLIEGGKIYVKAREGKEEARAEVDFLGLGVLVLDLTNPRSRPARANGSGGRI